MSTNVPDLDFDTDSDRKRRTNWEVFERLKQMGILPDRVSGQPKHSVPLPATGEQASLHVDESKRRYETILREAKDNQRYYLDQAKLTGKQWFHCPRTPNQYSEYVLISPEMAEAALPYNNNPRKRVKPRTIEAYARDMQAGRWLPTDESLSIDYNGEWYDGQHRLNAVIQSGASVVFYITWNSLIEARFGVDQGVVRSATEKLDLVLENNIGTKLAAICRSMMRGISGAGTKWTDAEICQFASKHGPVIEWVAKACPGIRADVQAVIAKAALWYGVDRIEPFAKRLADVMFTCKDDPARRLYEFVLQGKRGVPTSGLVVYRKALSAVYQEVRGRTIRALYERDKDIFEWAPGWTVPPRNGDDE